MKINSKEAQEGFKPIELSIVFETVQELEMFYGAVGCSWVAMEDAAESHDGVDTKKWDSSKDITEDLFHWADSKLDEIYNTCPF
ncbi:MAG: hypothetical protein WC055_00695 [Melioribacteraceae bacterium]